MAGRRLGKREQTYLQLDGEYLQEAREFFPKKDFVQASEKLWGVCAEIVKAVGVAHGVQLERRTRVCGGSLPD